VIAPGLRLRFDKIEGATAALEDPDCPVGSIYDLDYAYKFSKLRDSFMGGNALFTLPVMPIKCGGAPQKIMYLSEETWRKRGIRGDTNIHYYPTWPNMFPPCKKFADALLPIAESKNINSHFKHELLRLDGNERNATFKTPEGEEITVPFDLLHVVPPMDAPDFISTNSCLASANGFLNVDKHTMQHNKFPNIYGLGDICNIPTSKTAAAVFSQTPVVIENIKRSIETSKTKIPRSGSNYDGYASCPIFVGDKKLMLCEFKYGGVPAETFSVNQHIPSRRLFTMKKELLPRAYFTLMP